MIVAGFQMDIVWENPHANFEKVRAATEALVAGPTGRPELLVLPEMFATGFSMNASEVAAWAPETRAFLADLASTHSVAVLGGFAESGNTLSANACALFDPNGKEVLHYRKLHPFSLAKEDRFYEPGTTVGTAEVAGTRVTPFICYDLRFPEPFRPAAERTDLFCVVANWPAKRREAWSTLLRARAIENQAYVLGVNRVGEASGEPHAGDSVLVDPMGEVIGELPPFQEGWVVGSVVPREVVKTRRKLSFLKDRNPDLYRRIEDEVS
jgi:predicted amidohydrolase